MPPCQPTWGRAFANRFFRCVRCSEFSSGSQHRTDPQTYVRKDRGNYGTRVGLGAVGGPPLVRRVFLWDGWAACTPAAHPAVATQSLLGLVAGTSFGLLFPGACAGLPDGNCPGAKLALDGAIRSSSSSTWSRMGSCILCHLLSVSE